MQTTTSNDNHAWQCWLSIAIAIWVIATPLEASADPPHYRIDFAAPKHLPHCNDLDGFRGILALALSHDVLEPPASRVLDVRVDKPNGGDYVVELALKELDGKVITTVRETHPRSIECFKVLHSAALTAALEIDKDAPPDEPPARPEAAPPPPPPPPCPPCELPRAPAPKPLRHWFVGAGARIDMGVAPDELIGGHFIVGWRSLRAWSFEGHIRATLPQDTRPIGPTVVRVHSIASLGFVPCYRIRVFGLCGEFVLGNMWFTPVSLSKPRIDSGLLFGGGIRGFLEQRLSDRWSARMDIDLFVPVVRSQIEDDLRRGHWETSAVAASASASVFVWF